MRRRIHVTIGSAFSEFGQYLGSHVSESARQSTRLLYTLRLLLLMCSLTPARQSSSAHTEEGTCHVRRRIHVMRRRIHVHIVDEYTTALTFEHLQPLKCQRCGTCILLLITCILLLITCILLLITCILLLITCILLLITCILLLITFVTPRTLHGGSL